LKAEEHRAEETRKSRRTCYSLFFGVVKIGERVNEADSMKSPKLFQDWVTEGELGGGHERAATFIIKTGRRGARSENVEVLRKDVGESGRH